ncbi:hypothetical protein [Corynebacterium aquilae]|uniref:Uncharacterized protein n=1 Tax=Corynebacterium aquilae DSM 44791 TaxID=1431546 RepID=A0A1L7CHV1_9CORY|nr:hypothetical protein [Corynebacterium aquilae]APT85408.1 hypothetical protein CAQU_10505 [Corynebacterium aquilae DSM 44791]
MTIAKSFAALACSVSLLVGTASVALAAEATPEPAKSLTSSQQQANGLTDAEKEKARLAMTYGSTDAESAKKCAEKLHKGGGVQPKIHVEEDCSWVENSFGDVAQAWLGSSAYPGEALQAIVHNIFRIGIIVVPLAMLLSPFVVGGVNLPALPALPR